MAQGVHTRRVTIVRLGRGEGDWYDRSLKIIDTFLRANFGQCSGRFGTFVIRSRSDSKRLEAIATPGRRGNRGQVGGSARTKSRAPAAPGERFSLNYSSALDSFLLQRAFPASQPQPACPATTWIPDFSGVRQPWQKAKEQAGAIVGVFLRY